METTMHSEQTIVLDLDATLIATSKEEHWFLLEALNYEHDAHLKSRVYVLDFVEYSSRVKMWGIIRPYAFEFIGYCIERFKHVVVWSAGKHSYVHNLVDILFSPHNYTPSLVWTSRNCKGGENDPSEKPLEWLYQEMPGCNAKNTITLDDSDLAISENISNAIKIPEFNPYGTSSLPNCEEQLKRMIMSNEDTALSLTMKWLSNPHIVECEDFRQQHKVFN